MKLAWFPKAFMLILLSASLYACKDKNNINNPEPAPIGGKGGTATMLVVLEHSGLKVDSGMVYVKYNSSVTPVDNKYDDSASIKTFDGIPRATFYGLKEGKYFFSGRGWDIIRSKTVVGTRPYDITEATLHGENFLVVQVIPK